MMADSIDVPETRPNRYYCFGNLPVHGTSFALAVVSTVLLAVVFIADIKHDIPSGSIIIGFLLIQACFLAVIYGNRFNNIVFYWPTIYLLRPLALFCLIVTIYRYLLDVTSDGCGNRSYKEPKYIIIMSILLYVCNIFAMDSIYVAEIATQPSSFACWIKLKKRITEV